MNFRERAKDYHDPETMAKDYLALYFGNDKIEYPIDPFKMLKDEGIFFALSDFKKIEGIYIPASTDDIPLVGINNNRPITRQRFTAAHELCHHFRDYDRENACPFGARTKVEKFAEGFASAVLMPLPELKDQVDRLKNSQGYVSFDDILKISLYFGVSFEACMWRIAYKLRAIDGDLDPDILRKRISDYKPDKVRKSKHIAYANLYANLIDNYTEQLKFKPDANTHALYILQNNYIYNDSRLEGLDISLEQASEIVTDLRLNAQNSKYCNEANEAYMSIAGHYDMYQHIFTDPAPDKLSIFDTFKLNKALFSYYPNPDFGGSTRQLNAMVLGAKFETVDYQDIYPELIKLDTEVKECFANKDTLPLSEYIKWVTRIHHRITVIHPFPEGNGRTSRVFMNTQLIYAGIYPLYIKVEEKKEYIKALEQADKTGNYDELYEIIFRSLLRAHTDLHK